MELLKCLLCTNVSRVQAIHRQGTNTIIITITIIIIIIIIID